MSHANHTLLQPLSTKREGQVYFRVQRDILDRFRGHHLTSKMLSVPPRLYATLRLERIL